MALAMQHLFQQVANAAGRATYGIMCAFQHISHSRDSRLGGLRNRLRHGPLTPTPNPALKQQGSGILLCISCALFPLCKHAT